MKKNTSTKETVAQEALRLLNAIPPSKWIKGDFSDDSSKCCAIGHYTRLKSKKPNNYSRINCHDGFEGKLRKSSSDFLKEVHDINNNIAGVNNETSINGYTQKSVKARVIKCLKDMVKAGY